LTEIDLMRSLDNKHIMKLHEVFETENSLYFILDLLEGGQVNLTIDKFISQINSIKNSYYALFFFF
jgi:serine/threonine protein kinase